MTLSFGVTATLGSLRYETHVTSVRITLGLAPRPGTATVVLPSSVRVDAAPGDEASLSLHGESADVPTFGGVILRVERSLEQTVVTIGDGLAQLAMIRPGTTFEEQSVASIVSSIAEAAAIPTGALDANTELLTYVADQGRTALEHTARLAGWAGSFATSDQAGAVELSSLPIGPADRALRYGREIASLQVRQLQPGPDMVWAGSGPAGNISSPDAHLHTTTIVPEGAAAPGARVMRRPAPALRTPAAATAAITATSRTNATRRLHASCWLQPETRPGDSIEIADAPQSDALGPWFVTSVIHEVGPGARGITHIEADALATGGGLLAGLLGGVGGLL